MVSRSVMGGRTGLGRLGPVPVLACVAATVLAGCAGQDATARPPTPGWAAVPTQVAVPYSAPPAHAHARPVELRIPSIGVRGELEHLSVDKRGELVSPRDPARAGWFADGVRPGDPGPAVIAGHVDSRTGPAVFTRLSRLRPGALVLVTDAHGTTVRFAVDVVRTYAKADFPTKDVYGPTPDPQLRLITCGGGFDRDSGHYVDNIVVYAGLTA